MPLTTAVDLFTEYISLTIEFIERALACKYYCVWLTKKCLMVIRHTAPIAPGKENTRNEYISRCCTEILAKVNQCRMTYNRHTLFLTLKRNPMWPWATFTVTFRDGPIMIQGRLGQNKKKLTDLPVRKKKFTSRLTRKYKDGLISRLARKKKLIARSLIQIINGLSLTLLIGYIISVTMNTTINRSSNTFPIKHSHNYIY